jgi:hypothetical protein
MSTLRQHVDVPRARVRAPEGMAQQWRHDQAVQQEQGDFGQ